MVNCIIFIPTRNYVDNLNQQIQKHTCQNIWGSPDNASSDGHADGLDGTEERGQSLGRLTDVNDVAAEQKREEDDTYEIYITQNNNTQKFQK